MLDNLDTKTIFIYCIIVVVLLFIAKIVNLKLSFIFFLIVAIVIIYLINKYKSKEKSSMEQQTLTTQQLANEQLQSKLNAIKTDSTQNLDKYPDLVDFLYSIIDYKAVNEQVFNDLVLDLDNFVQTYQKVMTNSNTCCTQNLEITRQYSRNAINDLHSMIFTLDVDTCTTKRLDQNILRLRSILDKYSAQMENKCDSKNATNSTNSKSPHPFNYYQQNTNNPQFDLF